MTAIAPEYFSILQFLLDYCGYNYSKQNGILPKEPATICYESDLMLSSYEEERIFAFTNEEKNNVVKAYDNGEEGLRFVQRQLAYQAGAPWYESFPMLEVNYTPAGSWFFWRLHAMAGLIDEKGKITAYRMSNEIIDKAADFHPEHKLTVENVVKALGQTDEKPLVDAAVEEEFPEFVKFFGEFCNKGVTE